MQTKKQKSFNFFSSFSKELWSVVEYKPGSAIEEKKKLTKLILVNRGSKHYRW